MNSTVSTVEFAGGCIGRERHICAFFNSADEEYRSLLPFIKQGFARGERAVHILDKSLKDDHVGRLKAAGIDTDSAAAGGQLEIYRWEDAYLRNEEFEDAAQQLLKQGCRNVLLKLGERGCYVAFGTGERTLVPSYRVKAIDTTAAGDAFNGAFATALLHGSDPIASVKYASAVAAISVTRHGAQPSMPTSSEVEAFLREGKII